MEDVIRKQKIKTLVYNKNDYIMSTFVNQLNLKLLRKNFKRAGFLYTASL